jgi:hypothetical protein
MNSAHPRAHALRWTLRLTALWLLVLAVMVSALADDVLAGLICVPLACLGFASGVLWLNRTGNLPIGRLVRRTRATAAVLIGLASALGVIGLIVLAANGQTPAGIIAGCGGLAAIAAAIVTFLAATR